MSKLSKWVNFLAYVAVIFYAIAIALAKFISALSVLEMVAGIIAIAITCIASYFYARSKRNIAFFIIWIVAVVLIIVTYII